MPNPHQCGYSLVESLIAVALLAGAASGLLQLLGNSMVSAHEAALHGRAVLAAEEFFARARLADAAVHADAGPGAGALGALGDGAWQSPNCPDSPLSASPLSASPLLLAPPASSSPSAVAAAAVLFEAWLAELGCALPQAQVRVTHTATALSLELQWQRGARPRHLQLEQAR
ncbi:hypothetical protein CKO15_09265 [Halorhodospira abdelmalekii]|nr:hypothetical protein [Halorhodospira abdelmalekii]